MKITIEVEPVVLEDNLSDKTFYWFRIVGRKDQYDKTLIAHSSDRSYPGNYAVWEFINKHMQEQTS